MAFSKPKMYLDPSVFVNYFTGDEDDPEQRAVTRRFFGVEVASERYQVISSEIVLSALEKGLDQVPGSNLVSFAKSLPVAFSPVSDEVNALAKQLIAEGLIAASNQIIALHLAFALAHQVKYIISWDRKHMVKPKTIKAVKTKSLQAGIMEIKIITPEAVVISGDVV